jgi:bifunctional DNA-binding transcriptional regulator/antitoxin component of YhaV-PrlF toxin-antitoxin module
MIGGECVNIKLKKQGTSDGWILLPKNIREMLGIEREVKVNVVENKIVIEAIKTKEE